MNLEPTWLMLSLIPSGVGFVLFVYGSARGGIRRLESGRTIGQIQ